MPRIPDGVIQVSPCSLPLTCEPGCRSISDDDLCAWCMHLRYRPGEFSLCQQVDTDGIWPSRCDVDGYAQSCPLLLLTAPPDELTCR